MRAVGNKENTPGKRHFINDFFFDHLSFRDKLHELESIQLIFLSQL